MENKGVGIRFQRNNIAEPAFAAGGAEVGQRHRDLGGGGRLNKPLQRSRDECDGDLRR